MNNINKKFETIEYSITNGFWSRDIRNIDTLFDNMINNKTLKEVEHNISVSLIKKKKQ